jgi:hypothetical protein
MAALTATVAQTVPLATQSITAANDHRYGTVAQTLASITQASTGETTFWNVQGSMVIDGVVLSSFTNTETTTVLMSEEVLYVEEKLAVGSATIDGTVEYWSSLDITNSLTMEGSVAGFEWTTLVESVPMKIREVVTQSVTFLVTGSATIDGTIEFDIVFSAVEAATINNVTTHSLTVEVEAVSTLTISEALETGYSDTAISTLSIDEVATHDAVAALSVTGSMTATDETTNTVDTFEELLSSMAMSEVITFNGSIANLTVTGTAQISDNIWARDFSAIAWVLNTETGGLSTYDNFQFDSIAEYNGVLYGTSPEGLFAISGDDDEGREIDTEIQTGFLDFGVPTTKRVSDVFMGYTGGPLECDVETYDGPQEVYTYEMEEREANAPRNNRIKTGRGLSSRYWRFNFKNVDGAEFQVYDLAAIVGISRRRL